MRIYHHAVVSVANHANTRVPTPASSVALINHPRTAGRCINSIIIYDRPTSPRYFSVLRVTRDCNSLSRLCARSIARYDHSRRSTPSTISSPSFCDAIFFSSFANDQTLRYRTGLPTSTADDYLEIAPNVSLVFRAKLPGSIRRFVSAPPGSC